MLVVGELHSEVFEMLWIPVLAAPIGKVSPARNHEKAKYSEPDRSIC